MDDLELSAQKIREAATLIRRTRNADMDAIAVELIRAANQIERMDGERPVGNPTIVPMGNETVGFLIQVKHRGQVHNFTFSGKESLVDSLVEAAEKAKEM